jgi:hypothetical protein
VYARLGVESVVTDKPGSTTVLPASCSCGNGCVGAGAVLVGAVELNPDNDTPVECGPEPFSVTVFAISCIGVLSCVAAFAALTASSAADVCFGSSSTGGS